MKMLGRLGVAFGLLGAVKKPSAAAPPSGEAGSPIGLLLILTKAA